MLWGYGDGGLGLPQFKPIPAFIGIAVELTGDMSIAGVGWKLDPH